MNRRNYQKELEAELSNLEKEGRAPALFLHSCCAPCSSYVLEYLSRYFEITVFYYNPNISPASEYEERAREQERLIREMETVHPVRFLCGEYRPELCILRSQSFTIIPISPRLLNMRNGPGSRNG